MSRAKTKTKTKKSVFLKVFLIILLVLLIIFGGIVAAGYWYITDKLGKVDFDADLTADDIEVNTGVEEQLSGYRNIALLGIDARTDTFSGSRSDCIIIVSINEQTKDVRLLSIYRDTYLEVEDDLTKITHAYAYGGPQLTLNSLNKNLDLNITEYVTVNFETVRTVVDAVGGIKMQLTSAEAAIVVGSRSAGTYTLNGEQALTFARIRKIDNDYKRTERMRDVLTAVFDKAKTLSIGELNSLADTVLPHIRTNISTSEILSLIPDVMSYSVGESYGWPYVTKGITLDLWYGVPVTLEENVKQLHRELFDEENYEPSDTVKRISNKIIKKTGYDL